MRAARTVDPALSLRRSIAGQRGAQARWGTEIANRGPDQQKRIGYRMANAVTQGGRAVVDIHGEIGFFGINASEFIADLRGIDSTEIELHLSSPGGDVFDGIDIYWALVKHPATVEVHVDSLAGSIASVIAQAGDRVLISANGKFMIHDAIGGVFGNAAEMRNMADLLDSASDNIAAIYAERSGQGTLRQWRARMTYGIDGTWYTADEAVEVGLADEVVKAGARRSDPEAMWRDSMTARMAAMTHTRLAATTPDADLDPDPDPEDVPEVEPVTENAGSPDNDIDPEPVEPVELTGLSALLRGELDPPSTRLDAAVIAAAFTDALNNAPAATTPPHEPPGPEQPTLESVFADLGIRLRETLQ